MATTWQGPSYTPEEELILAKGPLTEEEAIRAVSQNGMALRLFAKKWRKNERVCLAAVEENWRALEYADITMKCCKAVVRRACLSDGWAIRFACDELRTSKMFIGELASTNPETLDFTNSELREHFIFSRCPLDTQRFHVSESPVTSSIITVQQRHERQQMASALGLSSLRLRFGQHF